MSEKKCPLCGDANSPLVGGILPTGNDMFGGGLGGRYQTMQAQAFQPHDANIYRSDLVLGGGSGRDGKNNGLVQGFAQVEGPPQGRPQVRDDDVVANNVLADDHLSGASERHEHHALTAGEARGAVEPDERRVGAGDSRDLPFDAREVFCLPGSGDWFRRLWFIDHQSIPWVWNDATGWWAPAVATLAESREAA